VIIIIIIIIIILIKQEHEPHRKRSLQQYLIIAAERCLPGFCLQTVGGYTDPQTLLRYDTDRIENDASNNFSSVSCIRCHGNVSTEPLPSDDKGYTSRHTEC
jgi:hypothetical protein